MSTMIQFERALAERLELSKADTAALMEELADEVYEHLKEDGVVTLRGLGKFQVKATPPRPEREGRNPATGETMTFKKKPAGRKLKVLPEKQLKIKLKAQ